MPCALVVENRTDTLLMLTVGMFDGTRGSMLHIRCAIFVVYLPVLYVVVTCGDCFFSTPGCCDHVPRTFFFLFIGPSCCTVINLQAGSD